MDKWEIFSETRYGALLKQFFFKLNSEIAEVTANSTKREIILLLNTKKGYWMYKVFAEKEKVHPVKVYSDRYVKKLVDGEQLKGKIIYLVDDTLTYGFSLLETFKLLVEGVGIEEKYVCPVVFALNERVNLAEQIENSKGTEASFWRKLKYYVIMTAEDMGFFCVQETQLLHYENVPYVVNMPYLRMEKTSGVNYEVVLTKEQFTKLQQKNDVWKFHEISYDVGEMNFLKGFIVQYRDELLFDLTRGIVEDYVVEGTYYIDEEDKYHMVFVPFVLAKSMKQELLMELWNLLLGDESILGMQRKQVKWKEYYRESIFALGILVAEKFIEYIKKLVEINLCCDFEILKEHFSEEFIVTIKKTYEVIKEDPVYLYNQLGKLQFTSREQDLFFSNLNGCEYSEKKAINVVWSRVLEEKVSFLQKKFQKDSEEEQSNNAILEIENIGRVLDETFCFSDKETRRYALSRIMIIFLQSSICSSQLYFDAGRKSIEKGIRYGENSDLAIPFFNCYFYWAVILMLEKKGEALLRIYGNFVDELRVKFINLKLFGDKFTDEDFYNNVHYYKIALENGFQLENKFFYLYDYFHGKVNKQEETYMHEIEKFVSNFN